jgi:hypothetical protein
MFDANPVPGFAQGFQEGRNQGHSLLTRAGFFGYADNHRRLPFWLDMG